MKSYLLVIPIVISAFCFACTMLAESPHEVALRIISSAPTPLYQPSDRTEEEQQRSSGLNSDAQLKQFMLSDSVPEKIRVCYALHLLVGRLLLARDLSGSSLANEYREGLKRDHDILISYLRQLNERAER